MTKHTPGPWTIDETYALIVAPSHLMAGNDIEIAACHAGRGADAKANAALIASAPEMLAAIKTLLDKSKLVKDALGKLSVFCSIETIQALETAIAKAEGNIS